MKRLNIMKWIYSKKKNESYMYYACLACYRCLFSYGFIVHTKLANLRWSVCNLYLLEQIYPYPLILFSKENKIHTLEVKYILWKLTKIHNVIGFLWITCLPLKYTFHSMMPYMCSTNKKIWLPSGHIVEQNCPLYFMQLLGK